MFEIKIQQRGRFSIWGMKSKRGKEKSGRGGGEEGQKGVRTAILSCFTAVSVYDMVNCIGPSKLNMGSTLIKRGSVVLSIN